MPGRPRSHDLATISERALLGALPASWTVEPRTHDYGIDFGVEIFRDGKATGLHFGIQLKATDKVGRRPKVRLKRSSANYWSSLDYPVLIVLFDASTGALWWQWWHRDDPFGTDQTTAKFTFNFPSGQRWSPSTAEEIEDEVIAYRSWANAPSLVPFSVLIQGSGMLGDVPAGTVVVALRRRLAAFSNLVELRRAPSGPIFLTVDIGADQTVIWLSGGPSATLHHENLAERPLAGVDVPQAFSADLVLLLAGRIALLPGMAAEAARLAASVLDDSLTATYPDMLERMMDLLLSGGRVDDALRLGLLARGDSPGEMTALLMLMSYARSADETSRAAVAYGLRAWSSEAETAGDLLEAGRWAYNAAQVQRDDDLSGALALLQRAGDLDPGYLSRGYWWREQGGILFLLGRHDEAAAAYRRAVDLGERRALPLLADALLHSSKAREAAAVFDEVSLDESLSEAEWRLKARVLRNAPDAGFDDAVLVDADALHAAVHDESTADAARPILAVAAALSAVDAPYLWLEAMAMTMSGDLFEDVAVTARRFCGAAIVEILLESGSDTAAGAALQELFEALPPEAPVPNVLRLIDPTTGEVNVIDL